MRRKNVDYASLRKHQVSTNATMRRKRSACEIPPMRLQTAAEAARQRSAVALLDVLEAHQVYRDDPHDVVDLQGLYIYDVTSVADIMEVHEKQLAKYDNHWNTREGLARHRLQGRLRQLKDEQEAIATVGLGRGRRATSLTRAERTHLANMLDSPDVLQQFTVVRSYAEAWSHYLRHCKGSNRSTIGHEVDQSLDLDVERVAQKPQYSRKRQWSPFDDEDGVLSMDSDEEEGEDEEVLPSRRVTLFDFVDAAVRRPDANENAPSSDPLWPMDLVEQAQATMPPSSGTFQDSDYEFCDLDLSYGSSAAHEDHGNCAMM